MTIPSFEDIMLPLLRLTSRRKDYSLQEVTDELADHYRISSQERKVLGRNGRVFVFSNRVSWAIHYMVKAGLLVRTGKGKVSITERGTELLRSDPAKIDLEVLLTYPEFKAFRFGSRKAANVDTAPKTVIVPSSEVVALPILTFMSDRNAWKVSNLTTRVADHFQLAPEVRSVRLPSGKNSKLTNRVAWAVTYLVKAGLLERIGHAEVKITQRGIDVLSSPPETITVKFLMQYPEFREFKVPQ